MRRMQRLYTWHLVSWSIDHAQRGAARSGYGELWRWSFSSSISHNGPALAVILHCDIESKCRDSWQLIIAYRPHRIRMLELPISCHAISCNSWDCASHIVIIMRLDAQNTYLMGNIKGILWWNCIPNRPSHIINQKAVSQPSLLPEDLPRRHDEDVDCIASHPTPHPSITNSLKVLSSHSPCCKRIRTGLRNILWPWPRGKNQSPSHMSFTQSRIAGTLSIHHLSMWSRSPRKQFDIASSYIATIT